LSTFTGANNQRPWQHKGVHLHEELTPFFWLNGDSPKVIFVYPSYAYGLPLIVRRFAKRAVFRTPYLAAFVTYGSDSGGTQIEELFRLLVTSFFDVPLPYLYWIFTNLELYRMP